MAIDSLEWVVIAAIGVVIFLWGPKKIPELARSIGAARKQIEAASKELQFLTKGQSPAAILDSFADTTVKPDLAPVEPAPSPGNESRTPDQMLIESARKLGIVTEGKTMEQISSEVLAKSKGPP